GQVISDKSWNPALKDQKDFVLQSSLLLKVERNLGVCYYQMLPLIKVFGSGIDFNNSFIAISREIADVDRLKQMETGIDSLLFVSALKYGGNRAVLYFTGKPLTYYRIHRNSIGGIVFSKPLIIHQQNREVNLINKARWLLKVAKWHGYVGRELPRECRCNDLELQSMTARLEALYLPTPLAGALSHDLVPSPSEYVRFIRCGLINIALSSGDGRSRVANALRFLLFSSIPYILAFIDEISSLRPDLSLHVREIINVLRMR
ncbi:glycosyltransferase family 2 protein, partial [Acidilobus sp.]|uniref:glycosyltransferase family 2 protein n=1 Tax=Acidilobus sp. TaxID=1872109 RepID=UPI003D029933